MADASAVKTPPESSQAVETEQRWQTFLETRDPDLRMRLIEENLQWTRMLAAKVYSRRQGLEHPFEDYLQCAIVALIHCIDRYDLAHGAKFRTYAQYRIEGALLNDLPSFSEQHAQIDLITRLRKGRMDSLVLPERTANTKTARKKNHEILEQMVEIAVGLSIGYMLEDYGMYGGQERIDERDGYSSHAMNEMRELMHDLVELLSPNERLVVKQHYFFGMEIEAISEQMQISKGRVSQLHRQGLRNLKTMAEKIGLNLNL